MLFERPFQNFCLISSDRVRNLTQARRQPWSPHESHFAQDRQEAASPVLHSYALWRVHLYAFVRRTKPRSSAYVGLSDPGSLATPLAPHCTDAGRCLDKGRTASPENDLCRCVNEPAASTPSEQGFCRKDVRFELGVTDARLKTGVNSSRTSSKL